MSSMTQFAAVLLHLALKGHDSAAKSAPEARSRTCGASFVPETSAVRMERPHAKGVQVCRGQNRAKTREFMTFSCLRAEGLAQSLCADMRRSASPTAIACSDRAAWSAETSTHHSAWNGVLYCLLSAESSAKKCESSLLRFRPSGAAFSCPFRCAASPATRGF